MGTLRLPFKIGPSGRYVSDQAGRSVYINGDTAWSLAVSASLDEADRYFADREARGFNATIVNAIERLFAPDPPRTVDGLEPFGRPGDLTAPNEDYFARLDSLLARAKARGITLFLAPLYLGYSNPHYPGFGGKEEGWHAEVVAAGPEGCRAYGGYLGSRWRDVENLVWVVGGDRNPGDVVEHMRAFVDGLRLADDHHLITAHVHPENSPVDQYSGDDWLTLNQTYSYGLVHARMLEDFRRTPPRPFVLFESTYEGEHNASQLQIRRQAWWALTCGASGSFFGNFPVWLMAPGWEAALNSPGAHAMSNLARFLDELPWWNQLRPDLDREFLVAGQGEEMGLDAATAAVTVEKTGAIAYLPTPRTVTVNTGLLAGWLSRIRWFDPVEGAWIDAGLTSHRPFTQFTSPSQQDWVLVLDDPAGGQYGAWMT